MTSIDRRWDWRTDAARVAKHATAVIIVIVALTPIWWIVNVVFAPPGSVLSLDVRLIPTSLSAGLQNMHIVLSDGVFLRAMLNSLIYSSVEVSGALAICSLAAFEFAHGRFRAKGLLYGMALVGLMVPPAVTVLPLQRIVANLGWVNQIQGIAVPGMASAFAVFLLTEYMRSLPKELIDAAQVDGLSRFGIYWRIAIPLTRNGLVSVGILLLIASWSNYLWPLLVTTEPSTYPVSVAVASYFSARSHQTTEVILAAALLTMIPIAVIYLFLQRLIIDSIARAGLRG